MTQILLKRGNNDLSDGILKLKTCPILPSMLVPISSGYRTMIVEGAERPRYLCDDNLLVSLSDTCTHCLLVPADRTACYLSCLLSRQELS